MHLHLRYEDFSSAASWLSTTGAEPPWDDEPSILRLAHDEDCPANMLKFDAWHNYHGGGGMNFISSSLVELLPFFPGSKMETRVENLDMDIKDFCSRSGLRLYMQDMTPAMLGIKNGLQQRPEGAWSKFDDTHVLSLY